MSGDPRVVIDARALVGNRTGIGVHTAEIASRLGLDPLPLLAAHAPPRDRSQIEQLSVRIDRAPLGVIWQQTILPRVLREEGADLIWGPHGTLPLSGNTPAIVSVHDLTSITAAHRHQLRTVLSFNLFIARSLVKASRIAAVSQRTAEQIVRGFGIAWKKIEVVPNGVGPELSPSADPSGIPPGLERGRYLLYAGTIEPRKGIPELLEAWEGSSPRLPLVLCGDRGWGLGRTRRRIDELAARGDLTVTGYVDRSTLIALMRNALAFVYPSRDEGFGLPLLEAMACGAPVVAAAGGAIPEVAGDAALLVPPGDAAALGLALARISSDPSLRDDLRARGIERARSFSWETSARRMAELMREAATGRF